MARPLRIQFPGAWYHVMNRGAGRGTVYPNDNLRHAFLDLLKEVHERYQVEIHAWCLMDNHYHLVCRTVQPNLDRAMRHVDGVYTQRHNRQRHTDGPLFRGRYKSILIDRDAYLAQLSRYVHCNPVEAGMVYTPQDWRWSSYHGYLERSAGPRWLVTHEVLSLFGQHDAPKTHRRYRAFVEQGVDTELTAFYARAAIPPLLGSRKFRERVMSELELNDMTEVPDSRRCYDRPNVQEIIASTAAAFEVSQADISTPTRGRLNLPRSVAMALCQNPGGYPLKEIAEAFGLTSYNGVSAIISRYRSRAMEPEVSDLVADLRARLFGLV